MINHTCGNNLKINNYQVKMSNENGLAIHGRVNAFKKGAILANGHVILSHTLTLVEKGPFNDG